MTVWLVPRWVEPNPLWVRCETGTSIGSRTMNPDQNAIVERLEVTKRYGLVADYLVSFTGNRGRLKPRVTVWRKDGTSDAVVQHYIAQLLKGLVPDARITVAE